MTGRLPELNYEDLVPTRDYLREVALALGALQRGFLPAEEHLWQHGLEVNMRGPITQAFKIGDQEARASLDLVKYKARFMGQKWPLHEFAPPEIWEELKKLAGPAKYDEPKFKAGVNELDTAQVDVYAGALWWMDEQFRQFKAGLTTGLASPVLLYPHHFDLALSWFPFNDDKQYTLGWSTGDENIAEPYLYLTVYPEDKAFKDKKLPPGAHWQSSGFDGAVLLYKDLIAHSEPENLFRDFAGLMD